MFGYLIASTPSLTERELSRYKACYCGLCRCLGERYGELSRLLLNYDMTFLVILLESLYEFDINSGSGRCAVHPKTKHDYRISTATEYAADMLYILSYFKLLDNWKDDGSVIAAASAGVMKSKVSELKTKYPRQYDAIKLGLEKLTELESRNADEPDAVSAAFGGIMGEIFVLKDDRWRDTLYNMGDALGRFIYFLDAAVDLEKDTVKNRYNPFRKYYGLDNYDRFRDILRIFLADAVYEYNKLPLVEDTGIMKNVLCTGLWAKFEEKYGSIQGSGRKSERK